MIEPEIVCESTQARERMAIYAPRNLPTDLFFEKYSTKISRVAIIVFEDKKYKIKAKDDNRVFFENAKSKSDTKNAKLL